MKKRLLPLLLAVLLLTTLVPIMPVQAISQNPYDYCNVIYEKYGYLEATQTVNVREMPTSKSAKIGILKKRDVIEVTGQTDTDWFRITYNGRTAYVYGYYFTRTKGTNIRAQYIPDAVTGMPGATLLDYHTPNGIRQFNAYLLQYSQRGIALYGPSADTDARAENFGPNTYSPVFLRIIDRSNITNATDDLTKFVAVTNSYVAYLKEYYVDAKIPISAEESTLYYNCLMNALGINAYTVNVAPEFCKDSNIGHEYSHIFVNGQSFFCDPLWVAQGHRADVYLYAPYENIILNDSHYSSDIWSGGLDFLFAHTYSYRMVQEPPKK